MKRHFSTSGTHSLAKSLDSSPGLRPNFIQQKGMITDLRASHLQFDEEIPTAREVSGVSDVSDVTPKNAKSSSHYPPLAPSGKFIHTSFQMSTDLDMTHPNLKNYIADLLAHCAESSNPVDLKEWIKPINEVKSKGNIQSGYQLTEEGYSVVLLICTSKNYSTQKIDRIKSMYAAIDGSQASDPGAKPGAAPEYLQLQAPVSAVPTELPWDYKRQEWLVSTLGMKVNDTQALGVMLNAYAATMDVTPGMQSVGSEKRHAKFKNAFLNSLEINVDKLASETSANKLVSAMMLLSSQASQSICKINDALAALEMPQV